jgi:diaminopimelate decarboxylase
MLFCEDVPLWDIVHELGSPCYVYSRNRLVSNFKRVEEALANINHMVCYALKANGNMQLVRLLAEEGCGADVVSGGELRIALKAGIPPDRIVFAGVGKQDWEIEEAVRHGIFSIHAESFEELTIIDRIAGEQKKQAHVAIRINPDIDVNTHPYIATGLQETKFGIEIERAKEAYRLASRMEGLSVEGVHCHLGSMIMEPDPYIAAATSLLGLVDELSSLGIPLEYVDIGGGLGIDSVHVVDDGGPVESGRQKTPTPEALFEELLPAFQNVPVRLIFEPGRFLIADAGALVTRVTLTKQRGSRRFVVVDAGMNDFIRPALYDAYHQIVAVEKRSGNRENVHVVGPICESGDFFSHERLLPRVGRGDLLALMAAGAYGYALSSNYNGRLRPPEVLVDGGKFCAIRSRESLDTLWEGVV